PFQYNIKFMNLQKLVHMGFTTHRDAPTKPQNPLILSHSSILLPTSTQIPMALFLNSRMCRC
ncbi:MAG: hypothetical protein OSJ61_13270, partial [Lachnospiraceae bacterium]|nr:hypothetical protein [Lachnospiraceae bacterium]